MLGSERTQRHERAVGFEPGAHRAHLGDASLELLGEQADDEDQDGMDQPHPALDPAYRAREAVALPRPLDLLVDLGDVDATADLERVRGILRAGPVRIAVISWLPATPDRGVRRRLRALASVSTETPLLVLDGGDALRRAESGYRRHSCRNAR